MLARLQKSLKEKDQGFTLIELLVVIVIIGILAAIAIPLFLSQRQKGVDASLKSDLKSAATTVETWIVDNPSATIPTETVLGVGAAGTAAPATPDALATLSVSEGNTITLKPSTTVGAYCVFGYNDGSSEATADDKQMAYISKDGGLQTTTPAAATCA